MRKVLVRRWRGMGEEVWILEDGEKRRVTLTALDIMFLKTENVLERMLGYDPAAAEIFLYTTKRRDEGYSYEELINRISDKEDVERVLDKLLDAGILTAKWEKVNGYWERRFFNRGEISIPFQNIDEHIKPIELYEKFITISGFRREVENRIINYFAHIGEILDPDHLIIEGLLKKIPYEELWKKMQELRKEINAGGVYESDIRFYHPSKKKIGIYDIPYEKSKIEIPQRKIRFIFFLDGNAEAYKFQLIPIINPKIPCIKKKECSYNYDYKFCENDFADYRNAYGEEEVCRDCILFNITMDFVSEFLSHFRKKFNFKINKCFWNYVSSKYKDTNIGNENKIKEILMEKLPELKELFEDAEQEIQEPHDEFKPPKFLHEEIKNIEREIEEIMERIGNYANKHGYKFLVLLLRKGYAFVEHKTDDKTIKEKLEEKRLKVVSDEEFKLKLKIWKLKDEKKLEELEKIIIFDDAIDKGEHVKKIIKDIYKILGEEKFKKMDIKIGAYIVNENHINELKEELRKKYGKEFIYDDFIKIRIEDQYKNG
nr:hypothetical protein [Methanophagales archaeon]